MNILILLEIASLGGHSISAFTIAKALKKRGHKITFATGEGPLQKEIKKEFPLFLMQYYYYHSARQTYFTWKSFRTLKELRCLVDRFKFDHIHAFDARSYILASMLAISYKIPVSCTLCGGITPYYNVPQCGKMIVFSNEQKKKFEKKYKWKSKAVEVISSRLDMEQFKAARKSELETLCRKYDINPDNRNIIMITNFLGPKVKAIKQVLQSITVVLKKYPDVYLVFIGSRGDFYEKAIEIGKQINLDVGRDGIKFTGAIMNAQRLLSAGHIVLGVGRSAFEGMAQRKPTLIVGEKGFAGTVQEENIELIWHYNFSGRNIKKNNSHHALSTEIMLLLEDREYYESVRHFGVEFLHKHINIEAGISEIEKVYSANAQYAAEQHTLKRKLNMGKILIPIIIDNYYNSIKSYFLP